MTKPPTPVTRYHPDCMSMNTVVTMLEGIAKNYLADLTNSLEMAKIALMTGSLQPNETHSTLELRVRDLQARVDRLAHDMKSINVL